MPELPEVEVVKKSLEKNIKNLIIKKIQINTKKLRYFVDKNKINRTVGRKIISIKRRSKYLIIEVEKNLSILVHLGMTGKFFILNKKKKLKKTSFYYQLSNKGSKHNHVIFSFNNNTKLIYNDVRKFGFIKVIQSNKLNQSTHLKTLGPEPLSKNFNTIYFKKFILNKKKCLKDLLMDQKFVSGLGNIYVNEVLFKSELRPNKIIQKISTKEIEKIIKFIRETLKKSIKLGGSSIKDFKDGEGRDGKFQQLFSVYGREGEKCLNSKCQSIIKKTVISNRSTFFCKSCQK